MTSPAITKSPQKPAKKSPSHSVHGTEAATEAPSTSAAPPPPEPFSWLRVFKLADLMMKQGC